MKGLFIKDLRLLMQQRTYFLVVVGITVFCLFSGQDLVFVVSYCSFLMASVAVGTISYDDVGNGLAYIFTWPVSRRQYVLEKYLFVGGVCSAGWLSAASVGALMLLNGRQGQELLEWLIQTLMVLLILTLTVCVMIPIQLKFGAEKGRIVMFLVVFAMFGCVGLVSLFKTGIRQGAEAAAAALAGIPPLSWAAFGVLLFAAALFVSVCASIRIVEKKEL